MLVARKLTSSSMPAQVLAQIVARRADEIADVFDEEAIRLGETPSFQRVLNHLCVQMANRAGRDLFDRSAATGEPRGVVLRGEVADQRGDATLGPEQRERLLQKGRLAG